MCTGVESLQLARWTIGGQAEQAVLASIGRNLGRLVQLDLAESLVYILQQSLTLLLLYNMCMHYMLFCTCTLLLRMAGKIHVLSCLHCLLHVHTAALWHSICVTCPASGHAVYKSSVCIQAPAICHAARHYLILCIVLP